MKINEKEDGGQDNNYIITCFLNNSDPQHNYNLMVLMVFVLKVAKFYFSQ
jgi:hypothetical protein